MTEKDYIPPSMDPAHLERVQHDLERTFYMFGRDSKLKGVVDLKQFNKLFQDDINNNKLTLEIGTCKPFATYETAAMNPDSNAHGLITARAAFTTGLGPVFKIEDSEVAANVDLPEFCFLWSSRPSKNPAAEPKMWPNYVKKGAHLTFVNATPFLSGEGITDSDYVTTTMAVQKATLTHERIEKPARLFNNMPILRKTTIASIGETQRTKLQRETQLGSKIGSILRNRRPFKNSTSTPQYIANEE